MNNFIIGHWNAIRTVSVTASVCVALLAPGFGAIPAEAQVLELHRGIAVGDNGVAARSRGSVTNGDDAGAVRRGGFAADGQGNGAARNGGCVSGQVGSGCRGRAASWNADGSFSRQSGAEVSGENGFLSSRRSLGRDADGNVTGARSTDASGQSGAYSGASSLENGAYSRDGTYSGTEGQSATVESFWDLGAGGSRAVTCVDATGTTVDCR